MFKKYESEAKSDSSKIIDNCKRDVDKLQSDARAKVEEATKVAISVILGE